MKDTRPYPLQIDSRYYNTLDIEAFSQMMKDPSYCYKFYWLEAKLQNNRIDSKFENRADIVQVRYSRYSEIATALRGIFQRS